MMNEKILSILEPLMGENMARRIAEHIERFSMGIYPRESGVRLVEKLISDYSITGAGKAFLESVAAQFPKRK